MRPVRLGILMIVCALIALGARSVPAAVQPELNRVSAEMNEILNMIEGAEPFSVLQDELGLKLLDTIDQARGADIQASTIDRMATMVETADGNVRTIVARALGEIGPPARRALPALQRAAEADEEILKQNFGIAVGPEGPYEAAIEAMRRIKGEPEPPNPPN